MSGKNHESDIKEIDCLEAIGHLYAYLDGELKDPYQKKEVERHLDHCKSCFSRAQLEKAINSRLQTINESTPSDSFKERVRNLLDKL